MVAILDQHDEFVAAVAADHIMGPQLPLQATGDFDQQPVTDRVAERVVNVLEAVDVEEQERGALVLVTAGDALADDIPEARPVGQAGERVVKRQPRDMILGGLPLDGEDAEVKASRDDLLVPGGRALLLAVVERERTGDLAVAQLDRA